MTTSCVLLLEASEMIGEEEVSLDIVQNIGMLINLFNDTQTVDTIRNSHDLREL